MSGDWPSPAEIARLRVAVAAMPEPRRSVYLFVARDGLDYRQVAARLGLTVDQIEGHLAEAVADLVRAIDQGDGPVPTLQ